MTRVLGTELVEVEDLEDDVEVLTDDVEVLFTVEVDVFTVEVVDFFEVVDVVDVDFQSRFSRSVPVGVCVDAALADAPVISAVATVVTSEEIEAATLALSVVVLSAVTAVIGTPVAEGDGAFKIASKSKS